jgi:gas vesicle protein
VTDRQALATTLVGAALGGLAGFLFFTERGRRVRREIEPALEDFVRELSSLRGTVQRAADVAGESWRLLNDMVREPAQPSHRYPGGQTSPF